MQQPSVQMISVWQMRLLLKNVLGGKIGDAHSLVKSYQYEVETAAGILKVNMGTDHVFKEGDVLRLYLPEDKLILVRR